VQPWTVLLIVAGGAALFWLAHRLGWIDLSNKSRSSGGGGGITGIGDEVFHPTRHEAQVELDRQTVLPAPAPLPGDGDLGIGDRPERANGERKSYDGRVRIDLSGDGTTAERRGRHSASE